MNKKTTAWIEAMRLRTLPVSVAGVFAGTAVAVLYDSFRIVPALICLLFAVIAQIASNFANEYYDFRNGLDRKGREGFRRGVTEGDISPSAMKRATYALLAADALLGCTLLWFGGWWMLPIGIAIALFAVGYSTGPYPLSHHGLGDIAVVVFFGIVPVMLTAYLQAPELCLWPVSLPVSLAVGLMAADVLIVNNYRDCDDDRAVGKHTTVVIFGRKAMSTVYLLDGIAAIVLAAWALYGLVSPWWGTAAGICLLVHVRLWAGIVHRRGAELNPMLGKTAMLLLASSLLMLIACATAV